MTQVDITIHLSVATEPGETPTLVDLDERQLPEILMAIRKAVRGVIGYPGDTDWVYAEVGSGNGTSIDVTFPDEEGDDEAVTLSAALKGLTGHMMRVYALIPQGTGIDWSSLDEALSVAREALAKEAPPTT